MDSDKLQQTRELYRFDAFQLDAADRRLWRENEPISLTPKQFDLLFYFVENAGRVAKKDELLEAVWADTYIAESTLARNVSWLRKTLGEYAGGESFIETVPKIGYRFTAEVTRFADDENALIIEEQTVQYFRGAEIIEFGDAAGRKAEDEEERSEQEITNFPPQNVPAQRSFSTFPLLFTVIVFVALTVSGFIFYQKHFAADTPIAGLNVKAKTTVKNITVDAAQENVDTGIKVQKGDVLDVSADVEYQLGTDQTRSYEGDKNGKISTDVTESDQIKIGSVVNLQNRYPDGGYLDAWGMVKNKPEFSIVPTEIMFVATHPNPNRDNGSGSWEIISATGKKNGETLVYGDEIHLRNMYPDAGYLDNCGFIKDMPVFKDFVKVEKFAVFTAYSEDRDNGTGTWIISSSVKFDGIPVLEGDGIGLENGFPSGGFLDTAGRVSNIPAFNDYDGSLLVFIHESTTSRRADSGIWIISNSKAALK